jgi:hypothetical protein
MPITIFPGVYTIFRWSPQKYKIRVLMHFLSIPGQQTGHQDPKE